MLTTAQASKAISDSMRGFDSESVDLDHASGRILRQTVCAERDQPPFDRVTMDGIAIDFGAYAAGKRQFKIQDTQYAGDPIRSLNTDANCIEVMTGAVLPRNTNCVIPVERISIENRIASIEDDYHIEQNQFVHPQGSDHAKGHDVLRSGCRISPMDIAIIASCGLGTVEVTRMPNVRVISTGNELVPAGQPIQEHQIRMSNGPALVAMLLNQGFSDVAHVHLPDDIETLANHLETRLNEADVLVLSGGVSMGKADYVPQVLKNLGVQLVFHKISQRPGKPMWFGIGPNHQAVFALPGNPVSALVCCRQYVLPALLLASAGSLSAGSNAVLAEDVLFAADLTFFLPVQVTRLNDGRVGAKPVVTNTSGDFAALGGTDGYVELARECSEFKAGTVVPLHLWARI